jgi:RNA polymerase sigma-70 factor (ECF subfamily)
MKDTIDAILVEQCLNGHKEQYAELIRRHQSAVFGLAYRMTNDRDDAADLAQEAFIRAYRKLASYNAHYPFRNWVLSICANLGKNRFRGLLRRKKAEETHAEIQERETMSANDGRGDELDAAMNRLEKTLRIPLVLKHVEGMSYEEIARVLGIGVSAAKMRVKRGRDELVRFLRMEGGNDGTAF